MAPEYGATCGFFPVDDKTTLDYLRLTGARGTPHRAGRGLPQGAGHVVARPTAPTRSSPTRWSSTCPASSPSSPGRSARRTAWRCGDVDAPFLKDLAAGTMGVPGDKADLRVPVAGANYDLGHGDVVIAAITSCTNTSNPDVLIAAGLVARKAAAQGPDAPSRGSRPRSRRARRWSPITSTSPGLQKDLDALGFQTWSAMAAPPASAIPARWPRRSCDAINDNELVAATRALGQPQLRRPRARRRARQLPRLAAAGGGLCADGHGHASTSRTAPIGNGSDGKPVYLARHLADAEGDRRHRRTPSSTREMFAGPLRRRLQGRRAVAGDHASSGRDTYRWNAGSTYVHNPPYFEGMTMTPAPISDIVDARILAHARRFDHHRPHLARPVRSRRQPGGQLPDGASGAPGRTSTPTARAAATTR